MGDLSSIMRCIGRSEGMTGIHMDCCTFMAYPNPSSSIKTNDTLFHLQFPVISRMVVEALRAGDRKREQGDEDNRRLQDEVCLPCTGSRARTNSPHLSRTARRYRDMASSATLLSSTRRMTTMLCGHTAIRWSGTPSALQGLRLRLRSMYLTTLRL